MRVFPNESWLVGFPDYGLLNRVIINKPDPDRPTLPEFLDSVGESPQLHIMDRYIQCRSGAIFFNSGKDLIGWEGAHVKGAWLDEFDLMPLQAYRRCQERTRMRSGYRLLTGTPRLVAWVKQELAPKWATGPDRLSGLIHVQESADGLVRRVQFPSIANPRYPHSAMEEARQNLPYWEFQRLYLGELAAMEGGGVFRREWWRYYKEGDLDGKDGLLSPFEEVIQVWDTAFKVKTSNDFSVCATWARSRSSLYLLDLYRGRLEYPDLLHQASTIASHFRPSRVLVEDKASGQSLIQDLRRHTSLPVIAVAVDQDKYRRAAAVTGLVESGRCYLPESAPFTHDFIEEHAEFPKGAHDDQVDTTSMALTYFRSRGSGGTGGVVRESKPAQQQEPWGMGIKAKSSRWSIK